jgi:hypothetical protein
MTSTATTTTTTIIITTTGTIIIIIIITHDGIGKCKIVFRKLKGTLYHFGDLGVYSIILKRAVK